MPSGWNWWHSRRDFQLLKVFTVLEVASSTWKSCWGSVSFTCRVKTAPPAATGHLFPWPADSSLRTFTDKHRRQRTGSFWMCPRTRQRLLCLKPTCLLCMPGPGVDSVLTRGSPAWLHVGNTWHCVTDHDAQTPHQANQIRISVGLGKGIFFF